MYSVRLLSAVQCHLLNIDVVTQFDPQQMEMLRMTSYDCQKCLERMKEKEQTMVETLKGGGGGGGPNTAAAKQ